MVCALLIPTFIHTVYNVFFSVVSLSNTSNMSLIIIILFVLSIYFIGIMFILRTSDLNKIFITNGSYPEKYSYLMRKNEFVYEKGRRYYGA